MEPSTCTVLNRTIGAYAMKDRLDLTDPVHVGFVLLVVLLVAAILCVTLIEDLDHEVLSAGVVALMLSACLVVKTQSG